MRHGSLFSGIGGFDLAAEWMGWTNIFHCENNTFCQNILKYYWPDAKRYGDITKTDFTEWQGKVDIISGGFPCQPYSVAGKRKGKDDDRHLWPEMLRAIREIQPRWVVGENVPGLLNWKRGMVLDEIKADLEAAGFEVFPPLILPACGKNAPHKRDRLWIIAYASRAGFSDSNKRNFLNGEQHIQSEAQIGEQFFRIGATGVCGSVANTECIGQQGSGRTKGQCNSKTNGNWEASWINANGGWPTVSPIRGRDDGLSSKLHKQSLEALGNAIVPQIAYEIFKAIEETEK